MQVLVNLKKKPKVQVVVEAKLAAVQVEKQLALWKVLTSSFSSVMVGIEELYIS